MDYYVGTKIVQAQPEVRTLDKAEGYAVQYEDGYTSWSPKEVFEKAYVKIGDVGDKPPHVQRLVGEFASLQDKYAKLRAFQSTTIHAELSKEDKALLIKQEIHMGSYLSVLGERIERENSK